MVKTGLIILFVAVGGFFAWVHFQVSVRRIPTLDRAVALTFDDGPNPPYTDEILKILKRHQVKATFFVIGQHVLRYPDSIEQIVKEGHRVGNHSFSHPHFWRVGTKAIEREISETDKLLKQHGVTKAPFRSPFGECSPWSGLFLWLQGRKNFLFDIQSIPPDFVRPPPEKIRDSILAQIHPGAIILLHDGEGVVSETVMALDGLITSVHAQGYRFSPTPLE